MIQPLTNEHLLINRIFKPTIKTRKMEILEESYYWILLDNEQVIARYDGGDNWYVVAFDLPIIPDKIICKVEPPISEPLELD